MEQYLNKIICGDAIEVLKTFPDESIDCIITSPPYWALRLYGDSSNELGQEKTFQEYVAKLVAIFDEVKRVLKPEGTCWVNLGDTYGTQGGQNRNTNKDYSHYNSIKIKNVEIGTVLEKPVGFHKSLCCIPDRFKIAMVDSGWICRNDIIWYKRNCMPSSVKDRFTVDYERIFFFVKGKKYYFQQQFEAYTTPMNRWGGDRLEATGESKWDIGTGQDTYRDRNMRPNKNGKNMRCVWDIPTRPSPTPHFAMYPEALVERMIKAGCPENGIVLDPFAGAGNTLTCAKKLNRNYIGIELYDKYCRITQQRIDNIQPNLFAQQRIDNTPRKGGIIN